MNTKRLLGTADVAKRLRMSRAGINRRVEMGTLKPVGEIGPRGIRVFDAEEIEQIAKEATK